MGKSVPSMTFLVKSVTMCWYDSCASFRWRGQTVKKETSLRSTVRAKINAAKKYSIDLWSIVFCGVFFVARQVGKLAWD